MHPYPPSRKGVLKKHALSLAEGAASGVPCLRRSGFAQAGRRLVVLTYSSVRSARPSGCGLAGPAFLNTPLFFSGELR